MVPGLTGKAEMILKKDNLEKSLTENSIDVLSVSCLIELLEAASINAIKDFIYPDQINLGTSIKLSYISPAPIGMKVIAHALLKRVENNRLFFLVNAYDEKGKIADGEHERIIISKENFLKTL